ncbi:peptidyl-prolyl cis-trans isomerase FKBP53-like [Miscanthus floridulus]|uniref:peptidyl-prolyl cis-trans isomerase FKBP53-like n=1 Tax=Miscanthus floridulus TaxID=154761 RepID=UPI00345AF90F
MSSFWGVEVKPGKPYTLTHGDFIGRLRLTQATLGVEVGKGEKGTGVKRCVLQCSIENKDPVFLCVLMPEQSETCHLELEFEEEVTFSVIGPRSIHLAGYYMTDVGGEDRSDSDSGSDSHGSDEDGFLEEDDDGNMVMGYSDSEDDDLEYDSESDDEEMTVAYNQGRGKSSVVIEEIQEDDKAAVAEVQKGSKKKQCRENGDESQLQLAVRNPLTESLESEDEDGFPVSFSESKKSSESVSKKKGGSESVSNKKGGKDKEINNEDRKRKSGAISDLGDSSGEVKAEIDGASSKKKKKAKDKSTAMDTGKVNNEEKEIKQHDSPAGPVSTKQKKKKNKNKSASEVDASEQSAKNNNIHKDNEEASAQEASKKNKKKKADDINRSESQATTGLGESDSKEPLQTRTFANGMIIQEVEMGKPDGKKATRGKKVSVRYIGKLKNGTIFDSNVSGRPFEFRLGVGQVISGWDVGVNGMRVGDKRRLTIPPSMGYGSKRVGQIPQNSTLIFDVELVNVK